MRSSVVKEIHRGARRFGPAEAPFGCSTRRECLAPRGSRLSANVHSLNVPAKRGSEPSFQVPLRSMNEARLSNIFVKSRKKGKRNLARLLILGWRRREIGKLLGSLTGRGFAPRVQDVSLLWHGFEIWKGEFSLCLRFLRFSIASPIAATPRNSIRPFAPWALQPHSTPSPRSFSARFSPGR